MVCDITIVYIGYVTPEYYPVVTMFVVKISFTVFFSCKHNIRKLSSTSS